MRLQANTPIGRKQRKGPSVRFLVILSIDIVCAELPNFCFLGEIAAYCRPVEKAEPATAYQLAVLFLGAKDLD